MEQSDLNDAVLDAKERLLFGRFVWNAGLAGMVLATHELMAPIYAAAIEIYSRPDINAAYAAASRSAESQDLGALVLLAASAIAVHAYGESTCRQAEDTLSGLAASSQE